MNSVSVFEVLFISLSRSLKTINNMKNSGFTFRKRLASFRYAFNGIRLLIQKEHNAWIPVSYTHLTLPTNSRV